MVLDKMLYDRLEVATDVSTEEIKKKGKKLLIKWHPDKHPHDTETATKKFQEIQEAISILENPEKRKIYDEYGMDGIKGNMDSAEANPFNFGGMFGGSMFGGHSPFGNMFQQREKKENIIEKLNIKLEQVYKEETVELKYTHKVFCSHCNQEGTKDGNKSECKDCNGKGVKQQQVRMGPMVHIAVIPCNKCAGKGNYVESSNKCEYCDGQGTTNKEKVVHIPLKNGLMTGIQLQLEMKGHHFKNQKTDLIVIINVEEHPIFKRSNDDLMIEVELKLYQALFGFNKCIEHLDGRKLLLQHTGKTEFGTIRKISNEGMKDLRTGNKGDLIIKFNVKLPDITNDTLIKALTLIDKNESKKEKDLINDNMLIKTIMTDVTNFNNKENNDDNNDDNDNNNDEGPTECIQQ
jgi:DnaJ family protein A protein 2